MPPGSQALLAVDNDEAGEKMKNQISAGPAQIPDRRCSLIDARPPLGRTGLERCPAQRPAVAPIAAGKAAANPKPALPLNSRDPFMAFSIRTAR